MAQVLFIFEAEGGAIGRKYRCPLLGLVVMKGQFRGQALQRGHRIPFVT